jgi:hypothetical protein
MDPVCLVVKYGHEKKKNNVNIAITKILLWNQNCFTLSRRNVLVNTYLVCHRISYPGLVRPGCSVAPTPIYRRG